MVEVEHPRACKQKPGANKFCSVRGFALDKGIPIRELPKTLFLPVAILPEGLGLPAVTNKMKHKPFFSFSNVGKFTGFFAGFFCSFLPGDLWIFAGKLF